jgi:hypothetical protein
MPNNGSAVCLPFEPPAAPASPAAEDQIGDVLVRFAAISVRAFRETQRGKMSAATRSQGGDLIAELYWARAALGESKFAATMYQQAQLRLCHGTNLSAETAAEITDDIIGTVNKVAAVVRAEMH